MHNAYCLNQADVEGLLKSSALPMAADDSRADVLDPMISGSVVTVSGDTDCDGLACDAVGAGLVQADAALGLVT